MLEFRRNEEAYGMFVDDIGVHSDDFTLEEAGLIGYLGIAI